MGGKVKGRSATPLSFNEYIMPSVPARGKSFLIHEAAFMARYGKICSWAAHLASGDTHLSDDLVHDAFVHFTTANLDLDTIGNLDGYLYTILRNLARSRNRRTERLRTISLDLIEYDSVRHGLNTCDHHRFLEVRQELQSFCEYACERRHTSRRGSVLLFRFFHGFTPTQTALLLRTSRAATDELLRVARKEAREYLNSRDRPALDIAWAADPTGDEQDPDRALLVQLKQFIYSSASGPCPESADLKRMYAGAGGAEIDTGVIGHVAGCRKCLSSVLDLLSLDSDDRDTFETGNATTSRKVLTIRPSRQRVHKRTFLRRGLQDRDALFEHEPRELRLAVNGIILAAEKVGWDSIHLTVHCTINEPIEFIEIYSEQDVRLLMLPVNVNTPLVPCEITGQVHLCGERTLGVKVRFGASWPSIQVDYTLVQAPSLSGPEAVPDSKLKSQRLRRRAFFAEWFSPILPWFPWPSATASLAIVLLFAMLFWQPGGSRLTAAAVVGSVRRWEDGQMRNAAPVLHRRFSLTELPHEANKRSPRRIVDVWRSRHWKVLELRSEDGKVLSRQRLANDPPKLSAETVWLFEPGSETFAALAKDLPNGIVRNLADQKIEIRSGPVVLIVRARSFDPIAQSIFIGQQEYRFELTFSENVSDAPGFPGSGLKAGFGSKTRAESARTNPHSAERRPAATDWTPLEIAVRRQLFDRREHIISFSFELDAANDRLRLEALVDDPGSRDVLRQELQRLGMADLDLLTPNEAQLREGTAKAAAVTRNLDETAGTRTPALLGEVLRQQFGGEAEANRLAFEVIRLQRQSAPTALHWAALGRRFPQNLERGLPSAQKQAVSELAGEMANAYDAEARRFDSLILPVLTKFQEEDSTFSFSGQPIECGDWQSASLRIQYLQGQQRRRVSQLFSTRITTEGSQITMNSAIDELRKVTAQTRQMLTAAECDPRR